MAQALDPMVARLDAHFGPIISNGRFEGAIVVMRGGNVVYERYSGAEAADAPIGRRSQFLIASISKTFTAAAIERLRRDGKLSLDDTLDQHLPGFPHAREITIRQLLTHQSGYASEPYGQAWTKPPTREARSPPS